ncbi:metal-sulfur cluster assembly factor [Ferrovibrio sp.]|uniref:metal-sulfur cluster assembly factor n=1 Tax=Ferrovibrio sp. TaxID=1917215 RepID=UPI000CAEF1A5|nr:metal-sulfur cluster assembly factor [Ferrovibrio sp.]PJI38538.1 MAG: hydroxylase [Ferrovibrio sp.]
MASQTGAASLDSDILDALQAVIDPEVGLSIVDLGLVYHAARTADAVAVAITLTTRACPLGRMIVSEAEARLRQRFPEADMVDVKLVWEPPWKPDRMTEQGRALLGHA